MNFYLSMNLTKPVTGFHLYIYFSIFLSYIQSIYLCTWILSTGYSPCTAGNPEPGPCSTWRQSSHRYDPASGQITSHLQHLYLNKKVIIKTG